MTTENDELDGDEGDDQDLDLEKLFDSIPTDQLDVAEAPESSAPNDPASDSASTDEDRSVDGIPQSEASPKKKSDRFGEFLDRIGDSDVGDQTEGTQDSRQDIQSLLGRMEGGSNTSQEMASEQGALDIEPGSGEDSESTESADPDPAETGLESTSSTDIEDATIEGLQGASDILFKASRSGGDDVDVCQPFFSIHPSEDQDVLLVSLRQSSEDRLDAFYAGADHTPANLAVITSTDTARSTTTAKGGGGDDRSNITVKVVNDPGDLTRLGITISNVLSSWQGNGNQTLVCFDSLSSLLQYADLQRVFRFIHVLQGRLGNVAATTHYHIDPEAHDSQTQATIRSLFDGVATVNQTGGLEFE